MSMRALLVAGTLLGAAIASLASAPAQAALVGRTITGVAVATTDTTCVFIYDTDTDTTWLRDWSYATTIGYTVNALGRLPWGNVFDPAGTQSANGFVAYLNSLNGGLGYAGVTGWRLPSSDPTVPAAGAFNATAGEIGHLWYVELGNIANPSPASAGPFLNMNTTNVNLPSWTRDVYAADGNQAWNFRTSQGFQFHDNRANLFQTPIVRTGDVLGGGSIGACCNRWTGSCVVELSASCLAHGLRFDGIGSTCSPATCKSCPADFDGVGGLTVGDIFTFLSSWFAGCP